MNAARRSRRAALCVRVSTDRQTVENQELQLRQVAERRGWAVVEVYAFSKPVAGVIHAFCAIVRL
jgi:DNA invertase Pin-like site-specific DNA recombinase